VREQREAERERAAAAQERAAAQDARDAELEAAERRQRVAADWVEAIARVEWLAAAELARGRADHGNGQAGRGGCLGGGDCCCGSAPRSGRQ
jgi:hypothetical protein